MIQSFACKETERFFKTGKSKRLPPDILARAGMRLIQINAATAVSDLQMPPSNRLENFRREPGRAMEHQNQ